MKGPYEYSLMLRRGWLGVWRAVPPFAGFLFVHPAFGQTCPTEIVNTEFGAARPELVLPSMSAGDGGLRRWLMPRTQPASALRETWFHAPGRRRAAPLRQPANEQS